MKVILFGGRDLGILTLKELLERKDLAEVVAVVPGENEFHSFASSMGLKILTATDINSEPFLSTIKDMQPDLMINVLFLQKYRANLLHIPKFGVVNVHPSKLPYYRGRDCIRWSIVNGEKEIGVTTHQMDEGLDTGQILLQKTFPIGIDDTFLDVKEKMKVFYPKIVLETIQMLSRGNLEKKEQLRQEGTYFPHRTAEDSRIKWTEKSLDIHNLIRASLEPGFYAFTYLGERKLYVSKSMLSPSSGYQGLPSGNSQRCGKVLDYDTKDISKCSLLVGTADGVISIQRCGFEEGKQDRARDLLKRGEVLH